MSKHSSRGLLIVKAQLLVVIMMGFNNASWASAIEAPHKSISRQWVAQSVTNADTDALHQQVIARVNSLFPAGQSTDLRAAILNNINELNKWSESDNPNLQHAAQDSLVNARLLLAIIETTTLNYTPHNPLFTPANLAHEMMQGGHILIADNGKLLDDILAAKTLYARSSSHYKPDKIRQLLRNDSSLDSAGAERLLNASNPDYSLRAEVIFNEALFGKVTKENGKTYTWFQFEGHSLQSRTSYNTYIMQATESLLQRFGYSIEKLMHYVDYLKYCWHGKRKNIGQYGMSDYTEKNPIVLCVGISHKQGETHASPLGK